MSSLIKACENARLYEQRYVTFAGVSEAITRGGGKWGG